MTTRFVIVRRRHSAKLGKLPKLLKWNLSKWKVDCLVSRTFARAQNPSRRAWLTATRRAVPGDRPTPSPRPVLTATRDFVSRHRSARRGRAPLRALFCPVRGLPPPVAVSSSTARHALPDPSYRPVRAADSQHTLECMARPAEQRSRSAVCRVSRRRGASRAVAAKVTMITRNYINFRNFY